MSTFILNHKEHSGRGITYHLHRDPLEEILPHHPIGGQGFSPNMEDLIRRIHVKPGSSTPAPGPMRIFMDSVSHAEC